MYVDHFVDQLRILAGLPSGASTDRVLNAFRKVRREHYAGRGPWKVLSPHLGLGRKPTRTPDADPKWLYHAALLVLDEEKGINIGDPCLWAKSLVLADIPKGARVLQVGAGVGYYTEILSEIVGLEGNVFAYEVEKALATRAASNVVHLANAEIRQGNAATDLGDIQDIDVIVAFAGVTHIPELWSSRLSPQAHLLLPFTGNDGWGAMIFARKTKGRFEAKTIGRCGFYPCKGARSEGLASLISELFSDEQRQEDWHFRLLDEGGIVHIDPSSGNYPLSPPNT
ncbi:MAG: hypothetical protein AAGD43_36635 [Pseudomonadota bacterium]